MITVDGHSRPWREGLTVAELLASIEDGSACPVIRMNDAYVARPFFENTPVPDGAEIYLIRMVAGG